METVDLRPKYAEMAKIGQGGWVMLSEGRVVDLKLLDGRIKL